MPIYLHTFLKRLWFHFLLTLSMSRRMLFICIISSHIMNTFRLFQLMVGMSCCVFFLSYLYCFFFSLKVHEMPHSIKRQKMNCWDDEWWWFMGFLWDQQQHKKPSKSMLNLRESSQNKLECFATKKNIFKRSCDESWMMSKCDDISSRGNNKKL